MKITTLVENTSNCNLKAVHGLSFYIETENHKILFDLGPDDTLFKNAKKKNIDLTQVDTVVISHGHFDHGGALKRFLDLNKSAKVYIQRSAYEPHFTKALFLKIDIGLDIKTKDDPRVVLLDGDYEIDDELFLFVSRFEDRLKSEANKALYSKDGPDDFKHEQNLLIREHKRVLMTGCAHSGVIGILQTSDTRPEYCIGGFHVYNPVNKKTVSDRQLEQLSQLLGAYGDIRFYTCHCTGTKAFEYLRKKHKNIRYISCGDTITI